MNLPITLIFLSFRLTAFLDLFNKLNNIIALENKFQVANTNLSPQNIVDSMRIPLEVYNTLKKLYTMRNKGNFPIFLYLVIKAHAI